MTAASSEYSNKSHARLSAGELAEWLTLNNLINLEHNTRKQIGLSLINRGRGQEPRGIWWQEQLTSTRMGAKILRQWSTLHLRTGLVSDRSYRKLHKRKVYHLHTHFITPDACFH